MKKLILILFVAVACEAIGPDRYESGQLRISFDTEAYGVTRAVPEVPDTGDFIITINDSKGAVLYSGKYSACPEVLFAFITYKKNLLLYITTDMSIFYGQ